MFSNRIHPSVENRLAYSSQRMPKIKRKIIISKAQHPRPPQTKENVYKIFKKKGLNHGIRCNTFHLLKTICLPENKTTKNIMKKKTSDGWHNQIMRIPGMCVKEISFCYDYFVAGCALMPSVLWLCVSNVSTGFQD